jgi:hypothetical protein
VKPSRLGRIGRLNNRRWRPIVVRLRLLPHRPLEPAQVDQAHVSAAPAAGRERFEARDPDVSLGGGGPGDPHRKVDDVIEPAPVLRPAHWALDRCSLCLKQLAELVGRHAPHDTREAPLVSDRPCRSKPARSRGCNTAAQRALFLAVGGGGRQAGGRPGLEPARAYGLSQRPALSAAIAARPREATFWVIAESDTIGLPLGDC